MTAIIKTYQNFSITKFICTASFFSIQQLFTHLKLVIRPPYDMRSLWSPTIAELCEHSIASYLSEVLFCHAFSTKRHIIGKWWQIGPRSGNWKHACPQSSEVQSPNCLYQPILGLIATWARSLNSDHIWTTKYCPRIWFATEHSKRVISIYQNLFTDNSSVIRNIRKSKGLYVGPPPIVLRFEVAEASSFKLTPCAEVMWLFRFTFWMYPFWQIEQI